MTKASNFLGKAARLSAMAKATGEHISDLSRTLGCSEATRSFLTKAAVPASTSSLDPASIGLLGSLAGPSIFYRALSVGRRVEFGVQHGTLKAAPVASAHDEGAAIGLSPVEIGPLVVQRREVAALITTTAEALRSDASEADLEREVGLAVSKALDGQFLAGLVDGNTPTMISAGSDATGADADVSFLLEAVAPEGGSAPLLAMNPATARHAAALRFSSGQRVFPQMGWSGGEIYGVPVVASAGVAVAEVHMLDAQRLALAAGEMRLATSVHASLEMDDAPTHNSDTPTETSLVSMFQTNSVAIRMVGTWGAERLDDAALAVVTGVNWGAAGSE